MRFRDTYIPYGAHWSTPFCRWQGSLASEHPIKLAAKCASQSLAKTGTASDELNTIHLGMTVPHHQSFFGAPWLGALMGADLITGPTISQACATSARVVASSAAAISLGCARLNLAVATDRISNGPQIFYPDAQGPGGMGVTENWVWDNFNNDPYAEVAMVQTAENIAAKYDISRAEQDDLTLHRYQQYESALANDRAFQRRYMMPISVGPKKHGKEIDADEGVVKTSREGLARLRPVMEGGTVTPGAQTHPADGNAGVIMADFETAQRLSHDKSVQVEVLSYGEARVEKAHMGMAPVPAAQAAMNSAELTMSDIGAVKTHNPFVVNDIYFARQMNYPAEQMNNFGSSLIFGHPQAATGLRLIIELIEELVMKGGGYGLFTGCAAGDTGAAIALKVDA